MGGWCRCSSAARWGYCIAEEITLTTYYPSPRGVYNELRTAGNMQIGSIESSGLFDPDVPRLHIVGDGTHPAFRVDDAQIAAGAPSPPLASDYDQTPFVIDEQGNVGIGTAEPASAYKLEINGKAKANEFCLGENCVTSWQTSMVPGWPDAIHCYISDGGGGPGSINGDTTGHTVLWLIHGPHSTANQYYYRHIPGGDAPGLTAEIHFNADGSFAGKGGLAATYLTSCDGKSISRLMSEGKAFNFVVRTSGQ